MKKKIHPTMDERLVSIMKQHCRCEKIENGDFIAHCIAKELNIKLNLNYMIDETEYAKYKLKEVNNCIDKLEKEKKELEAKING